MSEVYSYVSDVTRRDNPYYHTVSQTIHMNFAAADALDDINHAASLFHEYYHLIQAQTTTFGISNFIGLIKRFVHLFRAISGRFEVKTPLTSWARACSSDEELLAFASFESKYQASLRAGGGDWVVPLPSEVAEFSFNSCAIPLDESLDKKQHLARKLDGQMVGVPLLGTTLLEAHAEAAAAYCANIDSPIFGLNADEENQKTLPYTTVAGFVRKNLPEWPLLPTIYFLCEYSLETSTPDHAFKSAFEFLLDQKNKIPNCEHCWNDLWYRLEHHLTLVTSSRVGLHHEIANGIKLIEAHSNDDLLSRMFHHRMSVAQESGRVRTSMPLHFFPWETGDLSLKKRCFNLVAAPEVAFHDSTRSFGTVREDHVEHQAMLTAAAHLISVSENGSPAECPYNNQPVACDAERTLDCKQAPWMRGDIGDFTLCSFGTIGKALAIESTPFVPITTKTY